MTILSVSLGILFTLIAVGSLGLIGLWFSSDRIAAREDQARRDDQS